MIRTAFLCSNNGWTGKKISRFNWFPLPKIHRRPTLGRLSASHFQSGHWGCWPLHCMPLLGHLSHTASFCGPSQRSAASSLLKPKLQRNALESWERWELGEGGGRSGQARGSFASMSSQHSQRSTTTTHVPWWREAWFWRPSERLIDW